MVQKNFLKYNLGSTDFNCLIDALHAKPPESDQYTGEIVDQVVKDINVSGIISTISRTEMDINRPIDRENKSGIIEYRDTIYEILRHKGIINKIGSLTQRFLHLSIHGMKNRNKNVFEIGTRNGESCDAEISHWFVGEL